MDPRSMITVHYMGLGAEAKKKNCYTVMIDDQSIFTTVTDDPDVVTEWVGRVYSTRVGFEIEFDINTLRIGTLQLCLENRCLVFQLPYTASPTFPPALVEFFADPHIVLVGSHVGSKIGLLRACFPFQPLVQGKDFLGNAAFMINRKKTELASFGLGDVETNWDRFPLRLSIEQAHHACLDAFLNLQIWEPLPPNAFTTVIKKITYANTMLPFMTTSITPHERRPGDTMDCYDVIVYSQTIWITVTADFDVVKEWIAALNIVEISFEMEFDVSTDRVGTMQFFSSHRCLVFRLLDRKDCPPFLNQFLNTHTFAGSNDMLANCEALRAQFKYKGKMVRMGVDEISAKAEFEKRKGILESIGLGNGVYQWARPSFHLTDKEVHYAFVRVFLNLYFTLKCAKTETETQTQT